jgi:hypothetical protein
MWPFTSRRIFGNRWWAVGFVAFVCWQVADLIGDPAPGDSNAAAAATDISGAPVDNAQMQQMTDTLNSLDSLNNAG